MKHPFAFSCLVSALSTALFISNVASVPQARAADLAPLPMELPAPTLKGTPEDLPSGPNIEPKPDKPRPPFMAPKGTKNVALKKKVAGSDARPFTGTYDQVTDGEKEAFDDQVVEMRRGVQHVQVDLGADQEIYAVALWHDHRWLQVYKCVIVQVADDADFTQNVRTVYNNDMENAAGRGIGKDKQYFETEQGKLIDAKGVKARYVRCYSKGSNLSAINCIQEVEVYGLPAAAAAASPLAAGAKIDPLPFKVVDRLPDVAQVFSPSAIQLEGFLGARVSVNAKNRLLNVEEEPILAGFRKKPGSHPWIGEHAGKWMHAATLAWAYTGDPALRAKLDRVAAELVKAQEPDGYLGTYTPDKRFGLYPEADWDVWSHKYNLMGLLTYYQYTGNEPALGACRKIGDLLIATFGPGKKSIISAGTHVGMAATSVLEPVVLLYRLTGETRYLDFAQYIVRAWDEPNGPKILQTLLTQKSVQKTANGKAYEMLSNLVGLCELARVTGDPRYLQAALNAWEDVVAKRLYLTGSASQGEHFHADYELPNQPGASICETCVTTTWIQLNLQLLRLTGEARFGEQLERTLYNHLAGAQRPDGAQWSYYTALEGKKPYGPGINCCVSSGPRGMALAPQAAYVKLSENGQDALAANLFETSRVTARLGGQTVTVEQRSEVPSKGLTAFIFHPAQPATFQFLVRPPAWAGPLSLELNGAPIQAALRRGWAVVPAREWREGDRLTASFELAPKLVLGEHGNQGLATLTYGPFVLAYDQGKNPGLPAAATLGLVSEPGQPPAVLKSAADLTFAANVRSARHPEAMPATFVPFANAGADGATYRVWLRAPGADWPKNASLLADGEESRSRVGNAGGSIIDGDPGSFVVTFTAEPAKEDWFGVSLGAPATIGRIVFAHGKSFHDGGWFDASAGKPRVQVQREPGGAWETIGALEDYPATTAANDGKLRSGQAFTLRLDSPVKAVALRVIGTPACGDNPKQAFASCAELQAFTP